MERKLSSWDHRGIIHRNLTNKNISKKYKNAGFWHKIQELPTEKVCKKPSGILKAWPESL